MNKTQFEAAIVEAVRADPHNGAKWKPLEELFASDQERGSGALSNAPAERKTRVRQLLTRRQHPGFSNDDYSRYGVFVLDKEHATKQKRDPDYLETFVVRDLVDERPALPPEVCLESVVIMRHDANRPLVPLALLKWGDSEVTRRYQEWYPHIRVLDKTVVATEVKPVDRSAVDIDPGLGNSGTRMLVDRLRAGLLQLHSEMSAAGDFRSQAELETYYQRFRSRFGTEALLAHEGEDLLELMHGHPPDGQSLMYWLEFKNDNEFPAIFGSISGGSSLKFGVYKRKEGGWAVAGSDGNPKEIPIADAIAVARKHREQLVEGAAILASLSSQATQDDYLRVERALIAAAPDVADTVWGHKYFHLLFPRLLDDFHATSYQHYHLLRLLQPKPLTDGRYSSAWRYVAIGRELAIPLDQLTKTLLRRNGPPRRYWRIGTSDGTEARNRWDLMREGNAVAVGWEDVGDLSAVADATGARETIRALISEHYPNANNVLSRKAGELSSFLTRVKVGDIVCAADGGTVLGIGRVVGSYEFKKGEPFPHRRSVEWLALGEWRLVTGEGTRTTVWRLSDYESLFEVERILLESSGAPTREIESLPGLAVAANMTGVERRVAEILERKGQVILYGPPGTGKTYWALQTARDFIALRLFRKPYDALSKPEKHVVNGDPSGVGAHIRVCTFHPEYGYENFIEGYQPTTVEGRLTYVQQNGIFKQLCDDARRDHDRPFLLVIDEINRGDIARIFGELLTLLERDKRGRSVKLPLSGKLFSVPENVFVIGTMNTADRSIALLDVALRRRFGFVALMPDYALLGSTTIAGLPLAPWLRWVNGQVRQVVGSDGRHREIGHGYLWDGNSPVKDPAVFAAILRDDIVPLLEEYCFEDLEQLEQILGDVIVDIDNQRVRYEVFDGDVDAVAAALLAVSPELTRSETPTEDDQSPLTEEADGGDDLS